MSPSQSVPQTLSKISARVTTSPASAASRLSSSNSLKRNCSSFFPLKTRWRSTSIVTSSITIGSIFCSFEFARAEVLGQIIVCAQFESENAIHFVSQRGKHQDRDNTLLADSFADFP